MSAFGGHFPIGLGTTRLKIANPGDTKGIEDAAELVCKALDKGINYIDTSYTYSAGAAQTALGLAFKQTKSPFDVTVKVMYGSDKTADDARRRVEWQLQTMGLSSVKFFVCWTIQGYDMFEKIMQRGGIYDGALKMKAEGIIDCICCSVHASQAETIKIIESGAFEGITVSYSLLNAALMQPVLDCAQEHKVGVAAMNPLGGGLIAQNPSFFSFARNNYEDNTVVSSLRFVKAHPAVNIVLIGISNEAELNENLLAINDTSFETDKKRFERVLKTTVELKGFCTGCNYCKGCPQNIPIADYMQKRNRLLLSCKELYNRSAPQLVENLNLFYEVGGDVPKTSDNPCIKCGACEKKCTQKLAIIDSLADTFNRASKTRFSIAARKSRLCDLLSEKGYAKVGLYPNGGFADLVIDMYTEAFGEAEFEWLLFNSNPKMAGQTSGSLVIHSTDGIEKLHPDVIIVCSYKYDREIYESLAGYEDMGIKIVMLHEASDVPWVW